MAGRAHEVEDAAVPECAMWQLDPSKEKDGDSSLTWEQLSKTGVRCFKLDIDGEPEDDPELSEIKRLHGFEWVGRVSHPACETAAVGVSSAEMDLRRKYFLSTEEHFHTSEQLYLVVGGEGNLDVRLTAMAGGSLTGREPTDWARLNVQKGDTIQLPEGMCYRFEPVTLGTASAETSAGRDKSVEFLVLNKAGYASDGQILRPTAPPSSACAPTASIHPSQARYKFLHDRPPPTGLQWLIEPVKEIDYDVVLLQQVAMTVLGVILWVLAWLMPEDAEGYWMILSPFPFMTVWAVLARAKWKEHCKILEEGNDCSSESKKIL